MMAISADLVMPVVIGGAALGVVAIISRAALAGWRDWIALQRERLQARRRVDVEMSAADDGETAFHGRGSAVTRIEMADLRERLRNLEAIAAGVDL